MYRIDFCTGLWTVTAQVRLIIPAGATLPGSDPPGTALRLQLPNNHILSQILT